MGRVSLCLLVALVTAGLIDAAAVPNTVSPAVVHEKRSGNVHHAWSRGSRVAPDAVVPVRIGLVQNNLDKGEDALRAISDPKSSRYGKHMTSEEVHDFFAPSAKSVDAVRRWLVDSGISHEKVVHSENKGWIAADIPAAHAERLFSSELYEYEQRTSGMIRIGSDSYSLPAHLVEHVDLVVPGVKFSAPLKKRNIKRSGYLARLSNSNGLERMLASSKPIDPNDLSTCDQVITIACIRALYDIPHGSLNFTGNDAGLFEQGSYFVQEDLDLFYENLVTGIPVGTKPTVNSIDGGVAPVPLADIVGNDDEAILDIDLVQSLIYPQAVTVYQVDDSYYAPTEEARINTFNTFLDALDGSYCRYTADGITGDSPGIDPEYPDTHPGGYNGPLQCGVYKPTRVISASYGESEQDLPKNYVLRQCNEFLKLGLQGTTILLTSSDYGVGQLPNDPTPSGCLSGFGQNQTIYNPDYPAGCPWITTVGATQVKVNHTINDPEVAMQVPLGPKPPASDFSSSGGFSNYFSPPWYQEAAIFEYFLFHDPGHPYYYADGNADNIGSNGGIYNRGGRGYPDVSANGANLAVYVGAHAGLYDGTSLSAPIWNGVLTLINAERQRIGKGPVGFINPVLYANPWLLNDIYIGANPNCGSSGFSAVQGWDPVTGLGTPNYPRLLEFFLSLP